MRKIFILILTVIICEGVFAQHDGAKVDFKKCNVEEAVRLAKEKGLDVYCNFSTSWCSPCKAMFAEVYCDAQVGEMMNKRFISLYIDAEAKEWVEVAKKYKLSGYPTIVILNDRGEEKYRIVGARSKNAFITEINQLYDDKRSPEAVKKRYESGERTPQLIYDYAYQTMKNGDEKAGNKIINDYFHSLDRTGKTLPDNWFLYDTFCVNHEDEKAQYLINNLQDYYANVGKDKADLMAYRFLKLSLGGYLSSYYVNQKTFDNKNFEKVIDQIKAVNINQQKELNSFMNVAVARVKCDTTQGDDYKSFMKVCKAEFDNLDQNNCSSIVNNFGQLTLRASDKVKLDALELMDKYKAKFFPDGLKGYDVVVFNNLSGALKPFKRGDAIDFKDISFDEAVKLAKEKKKLVFIDCYTTWCGPCKQLANEVFTANVVKNYFDKNFVNLKIDMEKGEGVELTKRFKIKGFPTTLLVNGDGEVVYSRVGSASVEVFLKDFTQENEKNRVK